MTNTNIKNGADLDDFKFNGPYRNETLSIVIPFYNEENNIINTHNEHKRIETLFNVSEYIYIDNGSRDNTSKTLKNIAKDDKKIKIVSIDKNIGYGHGIKSGIATASSSMILLNHADLQFKPFSFFCSNIEQLSKIIEPLNIFPKRLNRPLFDKFNSAILRGILSIIYFHKVKDFNGQPKLMFKEKISNFEVLPDDFCIDLKFYNLCKEKALVLPVIQESRFTGKSSWNTNMYKRFRIFFNYISFALKNKTRSKEINVNNF